MNGLGWGGEEQELSGRAFLHMPDACLGGREVEMQMGKAKVLAGVITRQTLASPKSHRGDPNQPASLLRTVL